MAGSPRSCSICCKKPLNLLQIDVIDYWKHLLIPQFLDALECYLHIYYSTFNHLEQLEGFAATCQSLQQPQKPLKSSAFKQNGNWPLAKTDSDSIPVTSKALRLLFLHLVILLQQQEGFAATYQRLQHHHNITISGKISDLCSRKDIAN